MVSSPALLITTNDRKVQWLWEMVLSMYLYSILLLVAPTCWWIIEWEDVKESKSWNEDVQIVLIRRVFRRVYSEGLTRHIVQTHWQHILTNHSPNKRCNPMYQWNPLVPLLSTNWWTWVPCHPLLLHRHWTWVLRWVSSCHQLRWWVIRDNWVRLCLVCWERVLAEGVLRGCVERVY